MFPPHIVEIGSKSMAIKWGIGKEVDFEKGRSKHGGGSVMNWATFFGLLCSRLTTLKASTICLASFSIAPSVQTSRAETVVKPYQALNCIRLRRVSSLHRLQ